VNNTYDHNAANEQKWNQRAASYDDKWHGYFRFMQRELIASAGINSPSNFLDLGCGTGWAVRHVADLLAGKGKFIGVDISKGMIEKAKSNATGIPNVEFYEASAENLPFDNDYFDTAICSNSFHHYLHPEEALKEVKRVLRPNGRIHILDITADDWFMRWIDERVRAGEKEHIRFYSTTEYASMFVRVGLKYIRSSRVKMLYPLKVHVGEKES
jgi:ubiquinone/menaquinone biosynthesis C-methylase UbiE